MVTLVGRFLLVLDFGGSLEVLVANLVVVVVGDRQGVVEGKGVLGWGL